MNIIAAVDNNWAIGNKGKLLASLPSDMRFFKTTTMGKPVVMGRKTLESLPGGKPLEGRANIVLSKTLKDRDGITVVNDISELSGLSVNLDDVFVIGGAEVYRALLPYCSFAFITHLDAEFEADAHFPNLDEDPDWEAADVIYAFKEKDIEAAIVKYHNRNPKELPVR